MCSNIEQAFYQLKKQYSQNANHVDVSLLEKEVVQIKNTIKTSNDQLVKTLDEVEKAKSKIFELSKSLREIDSDNSDMSNDIAEMEEHLVFMERENFKLKQDAEGNIGRMEVLQAENRVLLSKFIEQETENGKLKKELSELNAELKDVCMFVVEFLGSDKKLWKIMTKVQEKQKEVDELQKLALSGCRHEEFSKELGAITEYYKNKLRGIEQDKMLVLKQLEDFKVEFEVLQGAIDRDTSEASGIIAEIMAVQCKKNCDFFRQNIEDQEVRLKKLEELLEKEKACNTKLLLLLESRNKENQDLNEADIMPVEVKDEVVLFENSSETSIIE